jgi:integrase
MASIWRNPKSKYWTACWRDAAGKQRRASTKTTDRRLARRIAEQYEKASRGKRTLAQVQKILLQLSEELGGEPQQSLRSFCADFLEEKKPSVSEASMRFYRTAISKLFEHLGQRSDRPISEVTERDLITLRNQLAEYLNPQTVNHTFVGLKTMFKAAQRLKLIAENPAEHIARVREFDDPHQEKRRPFTVAELQAVLSVTDPEWRSMILIGAYTGARLADIALLRWENVDLERNELRFVARKTGKTTILPVVGALHEHIASLPSADNDRAFLHPRAAESVVRNNRSATLSIEFGRILESAGLRPNHTAGAKRRISPLSFHSLRHTLITAMKNAGVAQSTVAAFTGHGSQQITDLYTHADRLAMERAVAALPRL